jgi:ubiquitin C-terminal hydrolase
MAEFTTMRPRGISNPSGLTCYVNSGLQALASCSALDEVLATASPVPELSTAQHQTKTDLAREFGLVFWKLCKGGLVGAPPVAANDFLGAALGLRRALGSVDEQQDAQDFVFALLDELHVQLKRQLSGDELKEMRAVFMRRWSECTGEEKKDVAELASETSIIYDLFGGA